MLHVEIDMLDEELFELRTKNKRLKAKNKVLRDKLKSAIGISDTNNKIGISDINYSFATRHKDDKKR